MAAWGRIIPARAGFTGDPAPPAGRAADHPRSRGVYSGSRAGITTPAGSSPLARGLPRVLATEAGGGRIIPARAGFTHEPVRRRPRLRDHPRSRGVYWTSCHRFDPALGSSPLARGLHRDQAEDLADLRIIPARAGFTATRGRPAPGPPDHPRSRGVYRARDVASETALGSSPLARGLRGAGGDDPLDAGIIPARAGFTPVRTRRRADSRDHPRSRGVYRMDRSVVFDVHGSSPLARGLPHHRHEVGRPGRIIPARAGFTPKRRRTNRTRADHPRSRGVYRYSGRRSGSLGGSSPLARGLRDHHDRNHRRAGIIPARAGFT